MEKGYTIFDCSTHFIECKLMFDFKERFLFAISNFTACFSIEIFKVLKLFIFEDSLKLVYDKYFFSLYSAISMFL